MEFTLWRLVKFDWRILRRDTFSVEIEAQLMTEGESSEEKC